MHGCLTHFIVRYSKKKKSGLSINLNSSLNNKWHKILNMCFKNLTEKFGYCTVIILFILKGDI